MTITKEDFMSSEKLGLGRMEKKPNSVVYFKSYRVIERGMHTGYIEVKRGNGKLVLIAPESIQRWPVDSKPLTKKQLELIEETKRANLALSKGRKKK